MNVGNSLRSIPRKSLVNKYVLTVLLLTTLLLRDSLPTILNTVVKAKSFGAKAYKDKNCLIIDRDNRGYKVKLICGSIYNNKIYFGQAITTTISVDRRLFYKVRNNRWF